jgi:hypothetical protein
VVAEHRRDIHWRRDQPTVGDGEAMSVAAEISQHLFGPAEWRLGIDNSVAPSELIEALGKCGAIGEWGERRRNRRERTRTGRKTPGRQATQRVPSSEGPSPGTTQWRCGWCCTVWPQVWRTAVNRVGRPDAWGRPRWWRASRPRSGTGWHRRRPCSGSISRAGAGKGKTTAMRSPKRLAVAAEHVRHLQSRTRGARSAGGNDLQSQPVKLSSGARDLRQPNADRQSGGEQ